VGLHANTARERHAPVGSVLDLDLMALDRQSEFVSVDKQSNDDVMHLNRFGKADRLACQALERTRNAFRVKVARDNGFWVQGTLRPW
jgi:hypothetical protein